MEIKKNVSFFVLLIFVSNFGMLLGRDYWGLEV